MPVPYGTRKLKAVGKDIVHSIEEDEAKEAIQKLINVFYSTMRKHGICWGTKSETGTQGANFEWTISKDAFINRLMNAIEWEMIVYELPDDLLHYEVREEDETD